MNYLMLYEAFKAKAISDIIKYLEKEYIDIHIRYFKIDLKLMQSVFDFELSQIRTEEVKYLPKKAALKLYPNKNAEIYNDKGVYNMKFWFSLDEGYLGRSVTVNKKTNIKNKPNISKEDLKLFKQMYNIDISTNDISCIRQEDYIDLETGDKVLGYIQDQKFVGYIYKCGIYNNLYLIQDKFPGGEPEGNDWKKYGRYSWYIATIGSEHVESIDSEHKNLHLINNNSLERSEYKISDNGSILNHTKVYDKADYAVVIDINSIYKRGFKKVTGIKKQRKEDREGAIALMSDEEIKKINIDNYFTQMFNKMGIEPNQEEKNLKDLQKIVKMVICQDMPFYSIICGNPGKTWITQISKKIRFLINGSIPYEDLFELLVELRKRSKTYRKIYISNLKKVEDFIKSDEYEYLNELFSIVNDINKHITFYLDSIQIKNLNKLNSIYYKLDHFYQLYDDLEFTLPRDLNYFFKVFYRNLNPNIYRYIGDDELEEGIIKMRNIYDEVKEIFKI